MMTNDVSTFTVPVLLAQAVYVTLVHVGLWLLVGCLGLYVRYRLLKVLSAGYTFLFRELFNLSQMPVLITTVGAYDLSWECRIAPSEARK